MANKNNSGATSGKSNKTPLIIVAIILVAVILVAYVITSIVRSTWNPSQWVKPSTEITTPDDTGKTPDDSGNKPSTPGVIDTPDIPNQKAAWGTIIDNNNNVLSSVKTYEMPEAISVYANVTQDIADSLKLSSPSVTVTAEHNLEFNNVKVDWSAFYPSGASASNEVKVTPAGDGSLTATIQVLKEFDKQIMLKVETRTGAKKSAITIIDYVKRVGSFEQISIAGSDFGDSAGIEIKPNYGKGTVESTFKVKEVSYFIYSDFEELVQSYLKFNITFKSHKVTNIDLVKDELSGFYCKDWGRFEYSNFIKDFDKYDQAHKNAIYYAWNAAFNEWDNGSMRANVLLDIEVYQMYNGKLISSIQETDYAHPYNTMSGSSDGEDIAPNLTLNRVAV